MNFDDLQQIVGAEPVFETGLLLAGQVNPNNVRRQLSRLTKSGHLIQLRRGLYALAPPFQKTKPHPFLVANRLVKASYVSRQSALAYYGLIPEYVPAVTSVTTSRPGRWENSLGTFDYRHIRSDLFFGYSMVELGNKQTALVGSPEKSLLDLAHLQPAADTIEYMKELRLQNLERINLDELTRLAERIGRPKLLRVVKLVEKIAAEEATEYTTL